MIRVMDSVKESEKSLDSQLWHAFAGGMVQIPPLNSTVFYFHQGYSEYLPKKLQFNTSRVPSLILCKVSAIRYMADPETDEVFAKIRLIPLRNDGITLFEEDEEEGKLNGMNGGEKPLPFVKTLTQSDANNGGGFSVPRYCAETILPRLDYSSEPPVQTIFVKDVHGVMWKFRHIYRGTPRRHLLTTGWSNFVNQKKLVAGDSVVFFRAENGDLSLGIRRAKRGIGGRSSGWNSNHSQFGGYCSSLDNSVGGRVSVESVMEAGDLAVSGQPFDVVYYPCASTPDFCVRASEVRAAMHIRWCSGMRFKMPFETEDPSRMSWFAGTISSVQAVDPVNSPDSPWRLLQVNWDEPDLLQNVKRVNPWAIEVASNMPTIHHLSPFSPPRKKMRGSHTPDLSMFSQLPIPSFCTSPTDFLSLTGSTRFPNNIFPGSIQGARHAQFGLSPPSSYSIPFVDFQLLEKSGPVPTILSGNFTGISKNHESKESSWLTMGDSSNQSSKENNEKKTGKILLFGQVIQPNQPMINSKSSTSIDTNGNSSSIENQVKAQNPSDGSESDRGSLSFEETNEKVSIDMFGVGSSQMPISVL